MQAVPVARREDDAEVVRRGVIGLQELALGGVGNRGVDGHVVRWCLPQPQSKGGDAARFGGRPRNRRGDESGRVVILVDAQHVRRVEAEVARGVGGVARVVVHRQPNLEGLIPVCRVVVHARDGEGRLAAPVRVVEGEARGTDFGFRKVVACCLDHNVAIGLTREPHCEPCTAPVFGNRSAQTAHPEARRFIIHIARQHCLRTHEVIVRIKRCGGVGHDLERVRLIAVRHAVVPPVKRDRLRRIPIRGGERQLRVVVGGAFGEGRLRRIRKRHVEFHRVRRTALQAHIEEGIAPGFRGRP